ncbi:MAG TPA: glycogen-binding domain-containing protein [Gemmatimonadaceae bacterium]|nr:glycogen-binding domain-containing protein [Gemmatimonadaceae bacterium]
MRRTIASVTGGLLVLIGMGRPLGAQHRSALDVGVSVVRFLDDSTTIAGPSVAVTSAADGRRLFGWMNLGGVGTIGAASGSATLVGGARAPIARRWLVEGSGELFGIAGTDVHGAAAASGIGRVIHLVGDGGIWGRAAASISQREAGGLPAQALEAGAWWSWSRVRVTAQLLDQRAKAQLFAGPQRDRLVGTLPVRYQEGVVGARIERDAASLELSAGVRRDPDASSVYEPTMVLTAAVWQSESRAWTLSLARQPPDWVRGADAAQWIAVGMRFYEPRPATARAARVRPVVAVVSGDTERRVRVLAPGARTVEVMADFTEWTPVSLTKGRDAFEGTFSMTPGTHRLVVRIDGGAWRPAANTPAVDDDLGGRVGLLVVP